MSGRHSRSKGARGEREFRDVLRAHGFKCERTGRSFDATKDDLTHDVHAADGTPFHFEVKFRERWDIPSWWAQASAEAGTRKPVVAFRRSRGEWLAVVRASDLLDLL